MTDKASKLFTLWVVPFLISPLCAPVLGGSVIINEIMPNPDVVADAQGEWFELYNTTSAAIDINGWTISDSDFDAHTINNGGALNVPANGYLVLGINGDPATNGGVTVDYVYAGFYLGNSGDEVILTDDVGPTEIDRVVYDGGPDFPHLPGASMELGIDFQDMVDNDASASWAEASVPFGAGDLGTPGAANTFVPEPSAMTLALLALLAVSQGGSRRFFT